MKRISLTTLLLALLLLTIPTRQADAQIYIGPHLGLNFDGTDLFLGGSAQFTVNAGETRLFGNPGIEVYPLIDNVTITNINLDVLYPVSVANLQAYAGGGLLFQFSSFDLPEEIRNVDTSDTDIGLNLKAGLRLESPDRGYVPFVELVQTLGAGTSLGARAGVFLRLGN